MTEEHRLISAESVTEGHPDKVCDQISDAILDDLLAQDSSSHVAVETSAATGVFLIFGEVTSKGYCDVQSKVRETLRNIGYTSSEVGLDADSCGVVVAITEQSADMLVVMSSGSVAWYLGDAGVWIEPTKIEAAEGQSTDDAALALARSEGCLLVTGVPSTVDPVAGSEATDEVLDAVRSFREGFSEDFASKVVCYVAPSDDDVSCILESGVEVSLGSATDISTKEAVVESVLAEPPSTWYLNVRVPSNYTLRDVKSDNVQSGSGVFSTTEGEGSTDQGTEGADSSSAPGGSEGEASTDGEQVSGEG